MGRLLEALKRLETEWPETPSAAPMEDGVEAIDAENPPVDASYSNQTVVLELPTEGKVDFSATLDSNDRFSEDAVFVAEDCTAYEESENFENPPFAESREEEAAEQLVEEIEEREAEPYAAVSEEINTLNRLIDEELPLNEEAAIEPSEGLGRHFEEAKSPAEAEPPRDAGLFGAMAQNILAQLSGVTPAVLFFTSPADGEGKTETIPPLAEALVKASGLRTIMVDANLHRPALTREWQFSSRRGIFDVLVGEADWWEAVQETGYPNLSILLNNGLPREHTIVSQPLAFSELIENLKREYQLVLIDAASLGHAECIPMLHFCTGVYLIVRLGLSSPRAVREASQLVARSGGNLLGCIAVGDAGAGNAQG